jgi:RimJ/RimL family protein N-acetyltransferase
MTFAPTLTTERLIMRTPQMADFDAFAAHCASDRASFATGPLDRAQSWREFASAAGQWVLSGFGAWSITDKDTNAYLGEVVIMKPAEFPEVELGWTLMARAEGKGFAYEAALAARDWAFGAGGLPTLVSYIKPDNARSVALAERLGAVRDLNAAAPSVSDLVYRHPNGSAI